MIKDDIQKAAIKLPFGMLEFFQLPFGLRNPGNTFQRMMNLIIGDLPFCFVYINDILIFSPNIDTQVQNLCQFFELLHLHGINIGLPQCVL